MIEADTVCLLDFYVHERVQRQGLGENLFKTALKVSTWWRELKCPTPLTVVVQWLMAKCDEAVDRTETSREIITRTVR